MPYDRCCSCLAFNLSRANSLLDLNVDNIELAAHGWADQFTEAVEFGGEGLVDAVLYILALPWKLIFAFVPPPRLAGGWLCFFIALVGIGALTALIGDLAGHMGCCMGLLPSVTAITFVALGTSLPDTFASAQAAVKELHADSSIGNITGSNSVNVFLGLGLPWAFAAVYWASPTVEMEAAWRLRYGGESWYVEGMPVGFAVPAGGARPALVEQLFRAIDAARVAARAPILLPLTPHHPVCHSQIWASPWAFSSRARWRASPPSLRAATSSAPSLAAPSSGVTQLLSSSSSCGLSTSSPPPPTPTPPSSDECERRMRG